MFYIDQINQGRIHDFRNAAPPEKFKIQVLICVFLASGNKIPRLSYSCKKAGFFLGKIFGFVQ
jgi:hypothetical protein